MVQGHYNPQTFKRESGIDVSLLEKGVLELRRMGVEYPDSILAFHFMNGGLTRKDILREVGESETTPAIALSEEERKKKEFLDTIYALQHIVAFQKGTFPRDYNVNMQRMVDGLRGIDMHVNIIGAANHISNSDLYQRVIEEAKSRGLDKYIVAPEGLIEFQDLNLSDVRPGTKEYSERVMAFYGLSEPFVRAGVKKKKSKPKIKYEALSNFSRIEDLPSD